MAENPKKAAAKAEYARRRAKGQEINLKAFADEMGVRYDTLRRWKTKEQWDEQPTRKRGGQPGNQNAKANTGGGAPLGNKNAEKDGAYSAVFFNALTEEEKQLVELTPLDSTTALQHEMKILKLREKRILDRIAQYEQEDEEKLHLSSLTDMRVPKGGEDGAVQTMGMYSSDTAFSRTMKLNEALYKVQGRIAAIANALRAAEENAVRTEMERQRLDIMRMRASGVVDVDGEDGEEDEVIYR